MIAVMGFYYEQQSPPDKEKPPGCLDTLVIIRVVMGILLVPVALIIGVVVAFALALYLFTVHPLWTLVLVVGLGVGVWLFARWDQRRNRPPGA
jgi:hypothetical protein